MPSAYLVQPVARGGIEVGLADEGGCKLLHPQQQPPRDVLPTPPHGGGAGMLQQHPQAGNEPAACAEEAVLIIGAAHIIYQPAERGGNRGRIPQLM